MKISITIPAFNEEEGIEEILDEVMEVNDLTKNHLICFLKSLVLTH